MEQHSSKSSSNYSFKVILVGESCTGKTSLLTRFTDDKFEDEAQPSLPTEDVVQLSSSKDKTIFLEGNSVKLILFETAGQEKYIDITTGYYRGASGIVFVFDLTNSKSFDGLKRWVLELAKYFVKDVPAVLVGTKCDLKAERAVSLEEAKEFAQENKMVYFDTSAKEGIGISEAFHNLAERMEAE